MSPNCPLLCPSGLFLQEPTHIIKDLCLVTKPGKMLLSAVWFIKKSSHFRSLLMCSFFIVFQTVLSSRKTSKCFCENKRIASSCITGKSRAKVQGFSLQFFYFESWLCPMPFQRKSDCENYSPWRAFVASWSECKTNILYITQRHMVFYRCVKWMNENLE